MSDYSTENLETSDYGRSSRFPRGWYILPAAVIGALMWVGIFALIF
jgi:hypothetical protein